MPTNNLTRSTSFRLALYFMAIFAVFTMLIGLFVSETSEDFQEVQAESYLDRIVAEARGLASKEGVPALIDDIEESARRNPMPRDIRIVLDQDCVPVAGPTDRLPPMLLQRDICGQLEAAGGSEFFDLPRSYTRPTSSPNSMVSDDDEAVAAYAPLDSSHGLMVVLLVPELEDTRDAIQYTLILALFFVMGLGLLGALLMTRAVAQKLEHFNALSDEIRRDDLSIRIPSDGSGDEFDKLADNLNAMLSHIEALFESRRQVINDIAHDLRTPLTRVLNQLELLRGNLREHPDALDRIDAVSSELSVLLTMFDALLRISTLEAGSVGMQLEPVDLTRVVGDVAELLEPTAAERGVGLQVQLAEGTTVEGDRHLLFQAFINVVENAIKYTPPGGQISIELAVATPFIQLRVSDEGPGIAIEHREQVFQRFFRLEEHRGTPGHGLGLSLVKAIADLHEATIHLGGDSGGLQFDLRFPPPRSGIS